MYIDRYIHNLMGAMITSMIDWINSGKSNAQNAITQQHRGIWNSVKKHKYNQVIENLELNMNDIQDAFVDLDTERLNTLYQNVT